MKTFQVNLIDSVPLQATYALSCSRWPACKLWLCAILLCDKISLLAFEGFSAKIETSSLIMGHMARMEREELLLDMFAYVYGYLCGVYLKSNRNHHIAKKHLHFWQLLCLMIAINTHTTVVLCLFAQINNEMHRCLFDSVSLSFSLE